MDHVKNCMNFTQYPTAQHQTQSSYHESGNRNKKSSTTTVPSSLQINVMPLTRCIIDGSTYELVCFGWVRCRRQDGTPCGVTVRFSFVLRELEMRRRRYDL